MLVNNGVNVSLADDEEMLQKHIMENGCCSSLVEFVSYDCPQSEYLGEVDEFYLADLESRRKRLVALLRA